MVNRETSITIFGVPRSHYHCHLDNFDWSGPAAEKVIDDFLQQFEGGSPHLLLLGPPGCGKTHLAVALYRWGVYRWGTLDCAFVHVPEFFHAVKRTFDLPRGEAVDVDPFRGVEDARRLVVLDDLLGRLPTAWEIDHVIFRLINQVYNNRAAVVVTTNLTWQQINEVLKPHEMSRLAHNSIFLEFSGGDRRL